MVSADRHLITITPYERRFRESVLDIIRYSYQRHVHLDWYEVEEWLDNVDGVVRLGWRSGQLVAVLAASLPLSGTSWVRLAALTEGQSEPDILLTLWKSLKEGLHDVGAENLWMLPLEPWLEMHTTLLSLQRVETLVTLRRDNGFPRGELPPKGVTIEPAMFDDAERMTVVDQASFLAPFQMTYQDMRRAYRASTLATVARLDGEIVGYQLSTRHGDIGHLARLAVLPDLQGTGIGSALVREMLAAFRRRQINSVSVNTQSSNLRSLTLYEAYGFERIRYDMPIFVTRLAEA